MDIAKNAYQVLCKSLVHVYKFLQTVMFIFLEISQNAVHVFKDIELAASNASQWLKDAWPILDWIHAQIVIKTIFWQMETVYLLIPTVYQWTLMGFVNNAKMDFFHLKVDVFILILIA